MKEQIDDKIKTIYSKLWELFKGFLTIILFYVLAFIGEFIFHDFYISENPLISGVSEVAIYVIVVIGLGIFYHKRLINDFKNFKKENLKIALKNWILGLGIMMIANLLISLFVGMATTEAENRSTLMASPITSIIFMVFLAPLCEELTFRASFKNAFNNWYTFAIFTGFLFGLAHMSDFSNLLQLLYIIPYGALGFFFAKAFYETDNIYTSFISHMVHNALCIIIILLSGAL